MPRRILTARELYEMAEPWREAASSPWNDSEGRYMGPTKPKAQPFKSEYQEDASGNCVTCGQHFSQPHKPHPGGDWTTAKKVTAADDSRHPDLLESEHLYGSAHTTGGRVLPGYRTAATPEEQEARLADPAGWARHVSVPPSQTAIDGARSYAAARGLPDPHQVGYENVMRDPDSVRQVGRAYDALPAHDPNAEKHFAAMGREVNDQYHHMTNNLGINVQPVDHDPYPDVHHMMADVDNNKRLQVMRTATTGSHPYFDDDTNDKFRAVHDFFGHAATGRSFDRHGEQAAYLAHSQMFTPMARPALHAETQGQNSSLILNGQFSPQKVATLPQEMHDNGSLGAYSPAKTARWYKQALPKDPDAQWGADVMRYLDKNPEGVTLRDMIGDAPTSGYMVSKPGEKEISRSRLNPHEIRQFVRNNADRAGPDDGYGGWSAPRTPESGKGGQPGWYHDVSTNIQDPRDTAETALKHNQQAVYDLDHDEEVSTPDMVNRATSPGIGVFARRNRWLRDG